MSSCKLMNVMRNTQAGESCVFRPKNIERTLGVTSLKSVVSTVICYFISLTITGMTSCNSYIPLYIQLCLL